VDININRCGEKYWHNDIDTQVGNKNSLEVQNKQDNDIDKQKVNIFPSHIEIQNHILCLKHYNEFMKKCFIWI
jgi:hypothetical protein